MKPTKKSISRSLPRFDTLRRTYRTHSQYGICPPDTLDSAFADLDRDGNVERIRVYAVGECMERMHYYGYKNTVDITPCIEAAIICDGMDSVYYDARHFRDGIIESIRDVITSDTNRIRTAGAF